MDDNVASSARVVTILKGVHGHLTIGGLADLDQVPTLHELASILLGALQIVQTQLQKAHDTPQT